MSTPSFSSYPDPDSEAKNVDVYHILHLNWSSPMQQQQLYLPPETLKFNTEKAYDRAAAVRDTCWKHIPEEFFKVFGTYFMEGKYFSVIKVQTNSPF